MKYLDKTPMFFGPPRTKAAKPEEKQSGTPFTIPEEDRCPSGRHSTRLTTCFCTEEK